MSLYPAIVQRIAFATSMISDNVQEAALDILLSKNTRTSTDCITRANAILNVSPYIKLITNEQDSQKLVETCMCMFLNTLTSSLIAMVPLLLWLEAIGSTALRMMLKSNHDKTQTAIQKHFCNPFKKSNNKILPNNTQIAKNLLNLVEKYP
ncbi:hypothetical protein FF38_13661 [Lucilia cuprina]|uniref:Uncharacterized protein n=1 Tax=Lucilia cuprina TaxID=7375 RepID=A0A0L0CNF8_LUCCU|nr:hypothetical protein FF38_13661 [Lucilia cuprina]